MNQNVEQLLGFVRAIWRRRWLAMAIAWGVALLSWVVVMLLPNQFEASAKVFVDPSTVLRPVLVGIATEDQADAQIALVREALLSRPQLESVARKTDLDRYADTPAKLDGLIGQLQKEIDVVASSTRKDSEGARPDNIYSILYRTSDRTSGIAVVRALLDNFVEGTLSGNRSGSAEAQSFLVGQIKDYEKRLAAAEGRLADFKKRNVGMIPGERGDYFSRLDTERNGLQQSETNLAIAVSRREELRRQLARTQPYVAGTAGVGSTGQGASSDVSVRVLEAEARLEDLLLRFTDKHPEVVALKSTIAELKQREAKEMAELNRGGRGSGAIRSLNANPVYQQMQSQLSQSEVEIASLRGAVSQHQREIANLRQFVNTAPEVEQEFARLNRDYGVTKSQYEALVKRLEQAKVGDEAARAGAVRFEIIEPPRADITPVWPNRALFVLIGTLAGLALGIAAALGLHLLKPTFDSASLLQSETGVPVLGSVSRVKRPDDTAAEAIDTRKLFLAAACLVGLAVAIVVLLQFNFINRLFVQG